MYDYGYGYGSGYGSGISVMTVIFYLLMMAVYLVASWKIYEKAGEPGWAALIPFYNLYVLFKITWGKGSKFWLLLIPIYNIVLMIQTYLKLAKVFGKSSGFAAGLILLAPVFMLILAFGDCRYYGPQSGAYGYAQQGYRQSQQNYQQSSYQQPSYQPQQSYQQPGYQPQQSYQQPSYQPQPQSVAATAFCPNCGAKLEADAKFCPSCGSSANG